jgi:beta-barrel assembly-enhancing protease
MRVFNVGYKAACRGIVLCTIGLLCMAVLTKCKDDGTGVLLFSLQDDITMGQQVKQEILGNPQQYPVLDRTQYAAAYAYLETMKQRILDGGAVRYKDEFDWELYIIQDDSTLNAFCAPGGFICVYTGLIKYLETGSQLAGVLGHEIAHADRRHTSEAMQKQYGLELMLSIVLGENPGALVQVASGLVSLGFSRNNETEADEYSVRYLCPTDYEAAGAAYFFQKLIDQDMTGNTPAFLSTHPNPDNRVQAINTNAQSICQGGGTVYPDDAAGYTAFQNQIP